MFSHKKTSYLSHEKKEDIFNRYCRTHQGEVWRWSSSDITCEVLEQRGLDDAFFTDGKEIGIMTLRDREDYSKISIKYSISIYESCMIINWVEEESDWLDFYVDIFN
ncbi:MAG TPA: hypothetical protein VLE02_01140 [Nitrosarchaeum sp.]|nr:hypothetical protein [Nitrosarchaeum sp.]